MSRAAWSLTLRRRSVDPDGTAHVHAELRDQGVIAGELVVTMTPERALRLEWVAAPGAEPLSDLQAWAKVAG